MLFSRNKEKNISEKKVIAKVKPFNCGGSKAIRIPRNWKDIMSWVWDMLNKPVIIIAVERDDGTKEIVIREEREE